MPREFHTWPHTARKIVEESLREFVGDGEGEDYEVLTTFINEVQAEALRAAADEAEAVDADALVAGCAAPVSGERGRQSVIDVARAMCEEPWTWLRARADRLDGRS